MMQQQRPQHLLLGVGSSNHWRLLAPRHRLHLWINATKRRETNIMKYAMKQQRPKHLSGGELSSKCNQNHHRVVDHAPRAKLKVMRHASSVLSLRPTCLLGYNNSATKAAANTTTTRPLRKKVTLVFTDRHIEYLGRKEDDFFDVVANISNKLWCCFIFLWIWSKPYL